MLKEKIKDQNVITVHPEEYVLQFIHSYLT